MSDEQEPTPSTPDAEAPMINGIDLTKLKNYLLLGTDADGKSVTTGSPNMQLQDMAALLARAQVYMQIDTVKLALNIHLNEQLAAKQASNLLTPHPGRPFPRA
jgi:hypothetical protein